LSSDPDLTRQRVVDMLVELKLIEDPSQKTGWDSLSCVLILIEVEARFGVALPDASAHNLDSVDRITRLILETSHED
jgi:acyl carrier protein